VRPAWPPPCAHPTTRRRPRPSIPSCRTGRRLAVGRTTSDLRLLIGVRRAHVRRWCARPSYCPAPVRAARPRPPVVSAHAHTRLNAHRLVTATDRLLAPPARRTCCRREVQASACAPHHKPYYLFVFHVEAAARRASRWSRRRCPSRRAAEPPNCRGAAVRAAAVPPPCRRRAAVRVAAVPQPSRRRAPSLGRGVCVCGYPVRFFLAFIDRFNTARERQHTTPFPLPVELHPRKPRLDPNNRFRKKRSRTCLGFIWGSGRSTQALLSRHAD